VTDADFFQGGPKYVVDFSKKTEQSDTFATSKPERTAQGGMTTKWMVGTNSLKKDWDVKKERSDEKNAC